MDNFIRICVVTFVFISCGTPKTGVDGSSSDDLSAFKQGLKSNAINSINKAETPLYNSGPRRRPCPCSDVSLCEGIVTRPKYEVFTFTVSDGNWRHYDWSKVTTVIEFIQPDDQLMCFAHQHGARVVMAAPQYLPNQLANATARKDWVQKVISDVEYYYLDGVNVDFEFALSPNRTDLRDGMTALIQELNDTMKSKFPNSQLTFDFGLYPNAASRYYDYLALSQIIDYAFIMTYDQGAPYGYAWANSAFNATRQGVLRFLKLGIKPDKLILGVPWYGYIYNCSSLNQTTNLCVEATRSSHAQVVYWKIVEEYLPRSYSGRLWDTVAKSPFANIRDPSSGQFSQLWYDDPESLGIKYALAGSLGLRGVGMWQADAIDYSDPGQVYTMWQSIP